MTHELARAWRRASIGALLVSAALGPGVALAQIDGPRMTAGCINISLTRPIEVTGRLTLQLFAGPPNFQSIASGDAEERTFIVELPRSVCVDDGSEFADPSKSFVTVQVSSSEPGLINAAVGRSVSVSGEAFAAHTGHHHAPLVLLASRVTVR